MKLPKRIKPNYVRCPKCNEPVHIDDLAMVNKKGFWHRECVFKIFYQDPEGFIIGGEIRS